MDFVCGGLQIHCIKEVHIDENCYMIFCERDVLVIDPSYEPEILSLLEKQQPNDVIILLTHEHYDHIAGINSIRKRWNCNVVCSVACGSALSSPVLNCARYYDRLFIFRSAEERETIHNLIDTEYTSEADQVYEEYTTFSFHDHKIEMRALGLHSPGSAVITINSYLHFTGDAWLANVLQRFGTELKPDTVFTGNEIFVFPGHGQPMLIKEMKRLTGKYNESDS